MSSKSIDPVAQNRHLKFNLANCLRWVTAVSLVSLSWVGSSLLSVAVAQSPTDPDAEVVEIVGSPVWVKFQQQPDELPAAVGTGLNFGDRIRTEKQARTQVEIQGGIFFRIGGDAVLTLQPQNELGFNSGSMMTWVDGTVSQPVRIRTPIAVAAIQGTTAFVRMPESQRWAHFFSWEGEIEVTLANSEESVILQGGEAVTIPQGATQIPPVYVPSHMELMNKMQDHPLMTTFESEMVTLPQIRSVVENAPRR